MQGEIMKKKTKAPRTVDEVWKECLRMWAWIDKHLEEDDITSLKYKWMNNNYEGVYINENCFFCEKARFCDVWLGISGEDESDCPGAKIDPKFRCENSIGYNWITEPHKFYLKLKQLNRKRLKVKK